MKQEFYINGVWAKSSSDKKISVINPATEAEFDQIPAAQSEDVDAAVLAARHACDNGPWPRMSGAERASYLRNIASELSKRVDEIANLEVLDNGKPFPEAKWDIEDAAYVFEFYANMAENHDESSTEHLQLPGEGFTSKVIQEPVGVVGAITPWNYPLLMSSWKVAPAIAAGCCVVLKPSEVASLTTITLAEICYDIGLPGGVINIVTGTGAEAGQPLVKHPGIDKIAFTGSVPTGSSIMQTAARDVKNISLELGGKSPFIIFEDSDIDKAVEWIMFGIFWNQGQVCSATSRVLVADSIYDSLLERLVEETKKITIGPGHQKGVLLGPLVNQMQYEKVLQGIDRGTKEGARLVCGGKQPAHLETGYFIEPTILADMDENSWIWQEEIFGPVLCIKPFSNEAEALRLANDSRFGLAAAVMSEDESRCERVARALRAGIVWVNCSQPTFTEAPWGGYKHSGIGRELGKWGFNAYLETKQITKYCSDEPWGWYIKH